MRTREGIANAAGFFNGEGSTTYQTDKRRGYTPYMRLTVGQVDRRVLDQMQLDLGVGRVRGPYRHGKNGMFYWVCTRFEEVQAAIAMMWPWLSEQKREQYLTRLSAFLSYRKENGIGQRRQARHEVARMVS